jgi:hypothetical protein
LTREFCGRQSKVNSLKSKAYLLLGKLLSLCLGPAASELLSRQGFSLFDPVALCFLIRSLAELFLFLMSRCRFSSQPGFSLSPRLNFLLRLLARSCDFE